MCKRDCTVYSSSLLLRRKRQEVVPGTIREKLASIERAVLTGITRVSRESILDIL